MMPVLRIFMLVTIALVAVLIALSNLGVNTTSLIAGASIFGLAISFGSQGLVQDIVSGLTLIFCDAMDVGDLVALLNTLGIARAHFCGFSDGAITLLYFARQHPERVHSLILAGAQYTNDERTLARAIKAFLTESGYETEVAGDAEQALRLLETPETVDVEWDGDRPCALWWRERRVAPDLCRDPSAAREALARAFAVAVLGVLHGDVVERASHAVERAELLIHLEGSLVVADRKLDVALQVMGFRKTRVHHAE